MVSNEELNNSKSVTLVDSEPDVTTKLEDIIAKDALAVVSTDAVDSSFVILSLFEPDCKAKLDDANSKEVVLFEKEEESIR